MTLASKPRIAIPEPHSDRKYTAKTLHDYVEAVEAAGGEGVPIPLDLSPDELAQRIKSCYAVLLPGSPADVDPEKYDEARDPRTAAADVPRDSADELLLQDAYNMRKPVFGICYGVQSLNVWRTGKLLQHVEGHEAKNKARAHQVKIEPGTLLAKLATAAGPERAEPWVNSSHHQVVSTVGDGLRVAAWSAKEGLVEAVEGTTPEHWILGVQWHPERTYREDAFARRLFQEFVQEAARWQEKQAVQKNDFEAVR